MTGRGVPAFSGRHLWCYTGIWQVHNPGRVKPTFNPRDLLTTTPEHCFWCQAPWRADIGATCPGEAP